MVMANPYGDIELDATGMRALAHPVRLRLLNALQRGGPSTATALSTSVGASPSVVSWHLRHLAKHGLVLDAEPPGGRQADGRQRWWAAAARGIRLVSQPDDEGRLAYRAMSRVMLEDAHDLPLQWIDEVEPRLDATWRELAGLANTTILVTADELRHLEEAFEAMLTPFVLRKDEPSPPAHTRAVRMMRYALPELATEAVSAVDA